MTPETRDELLLRYLDGQVTPEEMQTLDALLKTDPEARAFLREMATQAVMMADFGRERALKSPAPLTVMPKVVAFWTWQRQALALAAAIVVLGVVAELWLWPGRSQVILAQTTGAVSWSTEGGELRQALAAGTRLGSGTLTVEGATSSAQLLFKDGSKITLLGESEMTFSAGRQKRLTLRRGSLMAEVRPQPSGRPLLIRTLTAEVEVVGTRFSLWVQPGQTAVAVETGRVRLRRLADGSSVEVTPAFTAVATLDTSAELVPRRLPPAPSRWRQLLKLRPPANWQGHSLPGDATGPGRLQAVPEVSARRPDGTPIISHVVSVRDDSGSIASVQSNSVLRLRYRLKQKQTVVALLGLHHPTGGFAGHFQIDIPPDAVQPDADGWQQHQIPIASLEAKLPNSPRPPPGARVFLVSIACLDPRPDLEVAEVAIEPSAPVSRAQ